MLEYPDSAIGPFCCVWQFCSAQSGLRYRAFLAVLACLVLLAFLDVPALPDCAIWHFWTIWLARILLYRANWGSDGCWAQNWG